MKQSRLRDFKGKEATILDVLATLTYQTRVTLYKHNVSIDSVWDCSFAATQVFGKCRHSVVTANNFP